MTQLPHSKGCFVCGARNPIGMRLRFRTDGKIVETDFVPSREHSGFVNVIHGGILATLLDEIMVWACGVETRQFAYCAEMTVRYLSPSRPGEGIRARAELVENKRGRLLIARGELIGAAGQILATATGKYLPVKDVPFASLLEDFEGTREELESFFGKPPAS